MAKLTQRVVIVDNVEEVVRCSAEQVGARDVVQEAISQSGVVASQNGNCEQANVLEAILLRALGTDNLGLGGRVQSLILLQRRRVAARRLVVELLAAQSSGVKVRRNGQDPSCGDGVQGLWRRVMSVCVVWGSTRSLLT